MKEYLRTELRTLKPYMPSEAGRLLKMDANESPYPLPKNVRKGLAGFLSKGRLNLYPDSTAGKLRELLASYMGIAPENLMIGNGSDELLQIITLAFAGPDSTVLFPSPSFSMYAFYARLAGANTAEYLLDKDFKYNAQSIKKAISDKKPSLLYICSPNNPTGSCLSCGDIADIAQGFEGIVVADEAYGEFNEASAVKYIDQFKNLIILKTFSKAMGMAGLRVGYLAASKELVKELYKLKPPYNVNSFSQTAASLMLKNMDIVKKRTVSLIYEKDALYNALEKLEGIKPYPSDANFILIKVKDGKAVYNGLLKKGISVRHFLGDTVLNDYIRVTVGQKKDNIIFLRALTDTLKETE